MLSQVEAHRLAAAVNQLRADWPLASLSTWIRKNLGERAYRDAAVALTWVACDPETTTPARVLENGPWWRATLAAVGTTSTVTSRCPEHPANVAWNCPDCDADAAPPEAVATLAATVRRNLTRTPSRRTHPEPTPTDRTRADALRDQIDKESQP